MTSLPDFNATPNLLELAHARAMALSPGDPSVCGDESPPARGTELSLCSDESPPAEPSVCADEVEAESDVRLKTDIEQVGTTVYGLPLYHFRYKTGSDRFAGVMAQDVLEVMPDAVRMG